MTEPTVVLKVTKQHLEDGEFHIRVEAEAGVASPNDLLEMGLSMVAAGIAEEVKGREDDLEDVLDKVWNKLAEMVETTQRLSSELKH